MIPVPFFVVAWCFVVGACIGSFLNVVVWRLPRGMSLSWPGSLCPACRKPILFRDNVPIFGWLFLRGHCRACGAKIAPRYPIVEFLTATTFAILAYVELVGAGENLPRVVPDSSSGLVGVWIYHSALMALLIVTALFEFDGVRPPRELIAAGIVAVVIASLLFPNLYPVPMTGASGLLADRGDESFGAAEALVGFVGLLFGGALGAALEWGTAGGGPIRELRRTGTLALALCGGFLGWQAAVSTAAIVAVVLVFAQVTELWRPVEASQSAEVQARRLHHNSRDLRLQPAILIAIVTLAEIVGWDKLAAASWWPGPYASDRRMGAASLAVAAASMLLAALVRFSRVRSDPPRMVN